MRRREFITIVGSAAASWPLAARAQLPTIPVAGVLSGGSQEAFEPYAKAFRRGLQEAGFVEGQNLALEYRFAWDQYDRLPALADDLIQRRVAALPPIHVAFMRHRF